MGEWQARERYGHGVIELCMHCTGKRILEMKRNITYIYI